MTDVDRLLVAYPVDPKAVGHTHRYTMPRMLSAIDDERLRRLAAEGWLCSKAGQDWVRLQDADNYDDRRAP
jgi:hypothetical protein